MPSKPDTAAIAQRGLELNRRRPRPLPPEKIAEEKAKCAADPAYFIDTYCKIYDNSSKDWIAFKLWPAQRKALQLVIENKFVEAMKARQLGFTWLLGDCYPLWQMLFQPIAEILIFSQRDDEAINLLERIKGTYQRLPEWMKPGIVKDNDHEFRLLNGSGAQALPASAGGRSNAATYVFIDEADFIEGLEGLVAAAKPTVDAGDNKMVIVSTVNDKTPDSYFQRLYKASETGEGNWKVIFIPWHEHPNRTREWYEREKADSFNSFGTLDKFYKEYPETPEQALAPRELNKRFPPQWIGSVSEKGKALPVPTDAPARILAGLIIFEYPTPGETYGVGADPSGGEQDGDPAVCQVVNSRTRKQAAVYSGKTEPSAFGHVVADISEYYFGAPINFELNNHGHEVRRILKERGAVTRLGMTKQGPSKNPGWLTTDWSKALMYDMAVKTVQQVIEEARQIDAQPEKIIFDTGTSLELTSIDIDTLKAPPGQHDDKAVAWALAQVCVYRGVSSMQQTSHKLWKTREERQAEIPYHGPGSFTPDRAPVTQKKRTPSEVDGVPAHILERFGRFRKR